MKFIYDSFRSLEQKESGEIRRLRCAACGRRTFETPQQLNRHQETCTADTVRPNSKFRAL